MSLEPALTPYRFCIASLLMVSATDLQRSSSSQVTSHYSGSSCGLIFILLGRSVVVPSAFLRGVYGLTGEDVMFPTLTKVLLF